MLYFKNKYTFFMLIFSFNVSASDLSCKPVDCYRLALEKLQNTHDLLRAERKALKQSFKNEKEIIEIENRHIKDELNTVKQSLLNQPGKWPPGSYCIFKKGMCPAGFTPTTGALHALWMFQSQKGYVVPAEFGDSSIRHHGAKDRNPVINDWHGEIVLSTCCK